VSETVAPEASNKASVRAAQTVPALPFRTEFCTASDKRVARSLASIVLRAHLPPPPWMIACAGKVQDAFFSDAVSRRYLASCDVASLPKTQEDCSDADIVAAWTRITRLLGLKGASIEAEPMWLAFDEVAFHVDDAVDGHDNLFVIWHAAGPPRVLLFPDLGLKLETRPGDVLAFDGLQCHAARRPDWAHANFAALSYAPQVPKPGDLPVYLSINVPYTSAVTRAMGMRTKALREFEEVDWAEPGDICELTGAATTMTTPVSK
jgi:hypothetical protein